MYHLSMGVGHCRSILHSGLLVVVSIVDHVHGEPVKKYIYILRM